MPVDYAQYPPNWPELRAAVLERAGHCCEECGVANYAVGARDRFGAWHDEDSIHGMQSDWGYHLFAGEFPEMTRIVLTVHHVCEDPSCAEPEHLVALCQRCHLAKHRLTAQERQVRRGQLPMMLEG